MHHLRHSHIVAFASAASAAVALAFLGTPVGGACAWVLLTLVPGAACAIAVRRDLRVTDLVLSAIAFSPVFLALSGGIAMLAGAGAVTAVRSTVILAGAMGIAGAMVAHPRAHPVNRGPLRFLLASAIILVLVTGLLPQLVEWWRLRYDAWFHFAVVAEVRDFGVPPQDPYFAGMPLQYMWLYHVLVVVLSGATGIDPFRTMALINVQALLALMGGACLLGRSLSGRWDRGAASSVMLPLGLNAFFFLLGPLKIVRALVGEVRDIGQIPSLMSLSPPSYEKATAFAGIWQNPEFYLDKFMVLTAFGIGLSLMATFWYGVAEYQKERRRESLFVVFASMVGMLAFHSLVGFMSMLALAGGVAALLLLRSRIADGGTGSGGTAPAIALLAVAALGCLVMSPYIFNVMHAKDSTRAFPIDITLGKTAAMLLSAVGGVVLLYWQKAFFRRRDAQALLFVLSSIALVVLAAVVRLPASNMYDKPGYFVWFPVAVIAGWTLADLWARRHESPRARLRATAVAFVFLVPVNALVLVSCYLYDTPEVVSAQDRDLTQWALDNTPRDAVFIDGDEQVSMLVTGPRRYYFGLESYARHWSYDRHEMARRFHVRRSLLTGAPMDGTTIGALGRFPSPLYVIARDVGTRVDPAVRFLGAYFEAVLYTPSGLRVFRVRRGQCKKAAATGHYPEVPAEILLDESGF